jgi:D-arabinose 1-dehydrogenase-like Zn-dependent alcohol dehydrogenase
MPSTVPNIPKTQTAAVVTHIGGKIEFRDDYQVPEPGNNEVLAKMLYTGICQSGMSFAPSTVEK